jgi:hypothetical protein
MHYVNHGRGTAALREFLGHGSESARALPFSAELFRNTQSQKAFPRQRGNTLLRKTRIRIDFRRIRHQHLCPEDSGALLKVHAIRLKTISIRHPALPSCL